MKISRQSGGLKVFALRDQIVPVLALLQSTKSHLGARNVFLRVLEVFEL